MKKCTALLFCLFALFGQQVYAAENAPPQKSQASKPQVNKSEDDDMPQAFKTWEQENAPREASQDARYGDLWSKTLMLLIVVLLLLFVGTWYLKRFGGWTGLKMKDTGSDNRIQILEKRVISPKAVVYLLSIDGHKVALTETSAGIQVVQELGRPAKPFSLDVPSTIKE